MVHLHRRLDFSAHSPSTSLGRPLLLRGSRRLDLAAAPPRPRWEIHPATNAGLRLLGLDNYPGLPCFRLLDDVCHARLQGRHAVDRKQRMERLLGPNTAIIQSFAVGHNFPTHYPHFSGETIRYHFLFYFQAGNLTFLGLNLAWNLNLLSIITLVSTLALLMALGQSLFGSRVVGRIGAALFFFHGTLSFVAFFRSQPSLSAAFHTIRALKDFLPSGYPYRGELWGIWTQVVYLNQRHFASAVGILLIVLLFLIDRYRQHAVAKAAARTAAPPAPIPPPPPPPEPLPEVGDSEASFATREWDAITPLQEIPLPPAPLPPVPLSARLEGLISRIVIFDKSFLFAGCLLLGLAAFFGTPLFSLPVLQSPLRAFFFSSLFADKWWGWD